MPPAAVLNLSILNQHIKQVLTHVWDIGLSFLTVWAGRQTTIWKDLWPSWANVGLVRSILGWDLSRSEDSSLSLNCAYFILFLLVRSPILWRHLRSAFFAGRLGAKPISNTHVSCRPDKMLCRVQTHAEPPKQTGFHHSKVTYSHIYHLLPASDRPDF